MLRSTPKQPMAKVDQREALEALTRARLIELAQGFELDVSRRRARTRDATRIEILSSRSSI